MRHFSQIMLLVLIALVSSCSNVNKQTVTTANGFKEEYEVDKKTQIRNGTYKKFRPDGTLLESAIYAQGLLNGKRTLFYPSGKKMQEEVYQNDMLEGFVYSWNEAGVLVGEEPFVNNELEGVMTRYYDSGKTKIIVTFRGGVEDGPVKKFWPNGNLDEEGTFKVGTNPETGISNEDMEDKWHGERKLYDENGQLERVMDCVYGFCKTTWQR